MIYDNEPKAQLDFETRSACNLRKNGSWKYSLDPSTEVLCLAYRMPYWNAGVTGIWYPAFPELGIPEGDNFDQLAELFQWINAGNLVEAHSAWFERGIWTNILIPRGFPPIKHEQWRCSAAKAATHALPRNLEDAGDALSLSELKDLVGHKVMKKIAQPRKPLKAEKALWANQHGAGLCMTCKGKGTYKKKPCENCQGRGAFMLPIEDIPPMPTLWHESRELFEQLWAYCRQDIVAESALSDSIPDLTPAETELYLLDQKVNERGFQLDEHAVSTALSIIADETRDLNAQLADITGGQVTKATQREKVKVWFDEQGLYLPNTQKATIEEALSSDDLMPNVRQGLEIVRQLGRSSTAKYVAMRQWACNDGRVRGGLLYHGASTGRWPLTGDHEALTPNGWVRLDEWQGGSIACWQPDGSVFFNTAKPLQFTLAKDEQLVHLQNQKIDQISTSDHAMPVFLRERKSSVSERVWGGGFARKTVISIGSGNKLPLYGTHFLGQAEWSYTFAQTRVLIMTQADGHFVLEDGRCVRYRFKKKRKILRCMKLLKSAGIDFRMRVDACDGATVITIPFKSTPEWLWDFQHKTFSWNWLNVDPVLFFDELLYWDGNVSSPDGIEYTSIVKQNTDVVQALAHLSGRTCRVSCRTREGWSDAWRCGIDNDPAPVTFRGPHRTLIAPESPYVYCAQTPTGYFLVRRNGRVWITGNSGQGPQPHNFVRGFVSNVDNLWEVIKTKDRNAIRAFMALEKKVPPGQRSVMDALASGLRGAICAAPGRTLFVADYASIEARVLLWLAQDDKALEIFKRGEDIYCAMATDIYKRVITKADSNERQLGKAAVLGCGYQMGFAKFVATALAYGVIIDEEFSRAVVDTYRRKFWRVKQLWADQEAAAIEAVETGDIVECGYVIWFTEGEFLYCELPSGRRLAYPHPEIREEYTSWGELKAGLTYEGINAYNHQWQRQKTYGGSLVENIVQAIARDIMADAMMRCEASGLYQPVLSVHDEVICEVDEGLGNLQEFISLLTTGSVWTEGCPIVAEGWVGYRYKK